MNGRGEVKKKLMGLAGAGRPQAQKRTTGRPMGNIVSRIGKRIGVGKTKGGW